MDRGCGKLVVIESSFVRLCLGSLNAKVWKPRVFLTSRHVTSARNDGSSISYEDGILIVPHFTVTE